MDIDFEGNVSVADNNVQTPDTKTDDNKTPLNGTDTPDINDDNHQGEDNKDNKEPEDKKDDSNPSTGELEVGTIIEFDGQNYTIAENGDLVDDKGTVFKKAEEVKDWLASLEVENDDDNDEELNIDNIQKEIGIEITDDKGNPVTFTNDAKGVKSYIDSVIDIRSNELQEAAINKLYNDIPVLKEFVDYLVVNNGDYRGFGQIRDRSGITIDKENVEQQEAIIRAAAREFGNKSLNDSYIKYLKDSGNLYDEAVSQLEALVESDKQVKQHIQQEAEARRQAEEQDRKNYFDNVSKVINSKNIGGYKIPDTIVKEVDGKKISLSLSDFYDYVAKPSYVDADNNHITGYQKDLNALSDEELLNQELLDAYLKFTGGSYKDLIAMAVTENEVRKLKLRSKERRTTKTVKINKPAGKSNIDDIVLD